MFPSTRQTLLRDASGTPEQSAAALNALSELYWLPCRRYVQLRFRKPEPESEDLVQAFFVAVLEQEIVKKYDAGRASFRTYLRACLDQFVRKQFEKARAEKRGGQTLHVGLDDAGALPDHCSPEDIFHREWQRHMFTLAAEDLRAMCAGTSRQTRFDIFQAFDLAEEPRPSYEDLAKRYGLPVTTITNHLAWARRELRRLLEARVSSSPGVSSAGQSRREMRSLFATSAS